jgi:hypothetical protein
MAFFVAGLDLGQAQDFTALAVVEVAPTPAPVRITDRDPELGRPRTRTVLLPAPPGRHQVRHLHRFPLGTPYPAIVAHVVALSARLPGALLAVDATGVGRPVVDYLWQAGLAPIAITLTAGGTAQGAGRAWRVPKQDLVGVLQLALQGGRLQIAQALPLAEELAEELLAFRVRVTDAGRETYGAWREGAHDDLVLAVGVAVWVGEQTLAAQARAAWGALAWRAAWETDAVRISPF